MPKVYTRNARGIRGHVEAYVAAFDKHWNLALEDCFEIWTRKVKRKAPALGNFFFLFLDLIRTIGLMNLVMLRYMMDVVYFEMWKETSCGTDCVRRV